MILNRFYFLGANAKLSGVTFGDPQSPPLVMIHGMRDHALGLNALMENLSADYYVVAPDLRGHGHSDKTSTYTMVQFVADVKALYTHLQLEQAILVGHSLGGHIALRFAAAFPEHVNQLLLLDGMGPPSLPTDSAALGRRFREGVGMVLSITGDRRQIPNIDDAIGRLKQNNPLMSEPLAQLVVEEGTEPHPDGGVRWRWESAVNMVWHTFSQAESESLMTSINCPVLIVTGEHGLAYWAAMRAELSDPVHYQQELARRTGLFPDARHVTVAGAGHMLHYDQPKALLKELRLFVD
ncbi:MAG: pimeloyl-ACP methyl ester carboxylesterase [Candidatus Azotimanducaceae bacterium]